MHLADVPVFQSSSVLAVLSALQRHDIVRGDEKDKVNRQRTLSEEKDMRRPWPKVESGKPSRTCGEKSSMAVACGLLHTLAVAEEGQVLACGCGVHGPLGLGDTQDRLRMTRLAGDFTVRVVTC